MNGTGLPDHGPVRVLVVDDDEDSLDRMAAALERDLEAVAVDTATGVAAGLDQLDGSPVDCIVSAHRPPAIDGLVLLRQVRTAHPNLPFVLCPARSSDELASEAVALGISGYLPASGTAAHHEAVAERVAACTAPRRSEPEATPTEERYEKLIRHSTDVVFVVDAEGTYQYVSPAVESVLGYEPEALVGVNGFELVHPDDVEATMAEFFRAVENPAHEPMVEFRARHEDGSWRWLEVRGRNRLDDPVVEGFVVNGRDVTERKEYERRVAEREQHLRQIAEHLPETVIWMTDPGFTEVHYVSPGYEDIWGRPVEQLYENPVAYLDGVHPDDRQRLLDAMAELQDRAGGGGDQDVDQIEYRVVKPDGSRCWVQGTTVGLHGDDGAVTRWVGIATDVTDRKARERELETYEVLGRTIPDGVFLVDETGTMHHVNQAWGEMVGRDPSELEGMPFTDLVEAGIVDETVPQRYNDLVRGLLSSETDGQHGSLTIHTTLPGQDREHVYEAHVGLLPYDGSFRGCAVFVRDVTAITRRSAGEDGRDPPT